MKINIQIELDKLNTFEILFKNGKAFGIKHFLSSKERNALFQAASLFLEEIKGGQS